MLRTSVLILLFMTFESGAAHREAYLSNQKSGSHGDHAGYAAHTPEAERRAVAIAGAPVCPAREGTVCSPSLATTLDVGDAGDDIARHGDPPDIQI